MVLNFFAMTQTGILKICLWFTGFVLFSGTISAQFRPKLKWSEDGNSFFEFSNGRIVEKNLGDTIVKRTFADLTGIKDFNGGKEVLVQDFQFSSDMAKLLVFTNATKVWRFKTKGAYWVYDLKSKKWQKLGTGLPEASLMFAKFSPAGDRVAYVSGNNLFVEELETKKVMKLTSDGADHVFNGTFDWAYQEEFGVRDGFRWSPDGNHLAYWRIDSRAIPDYSIVNNTDSIYPTVRKFSYAKAGRPPGIPDIFVTDISSRKVVKIPLPMNAETGYVPRMEWAPGGKSLVLQHLNRRQTESNILSYDLTTGKCSQVFAEKSKTWIDVTSAWNNFDPSGWEWLSSGREFIWISEEEGWRKLYRIGLEGKKTAISPGNYDVMEVYLVDNKAGFVYFSASPDNATERYCYRVKLTGSEAERVSPQAEKGVHNYQFSPNGTRAIHSFVTTSASREGEIVEIPRHNILMNAKTKGDLPEGAPRAEFFKVVTNGGVEMDGWMVKPNNFNPQKKYPVLFYVYGEPADASVVVDFQLGLMNPLYQGKLAEDGYIYMAVENRGTPVPKGSRWRTAVHGKIGLVNIQDQAMAAAKIREWPFVDSTRIAVWGMSGGGSTTLNLLFQHPEIYTAGIAISAVTDMRTYDNIYQERYMGIPSENAENYRLGSAVSHAGKLKGKLLYIHGTADDNVHYQNCELLVNELIRYNKQFELMVYPNRSHSFSEGEGTFRHLSTLFTNFLQKNCPPGGR